jgi:hypothetical protein
MALRLLVGAGTVAASTLSPPLLDLLSDSISIACNLRLL